MTEFEIIDNVTKNIRSGNIIADVAIRLCVTTVAVIAGNMIYNRITNSTKKSENKDAMNSGNTVNDPFDGNYMEVGGQMDN